MPDDLTIVNMHSSLVPDFECWLEQRGLYLSPPVRLGEIADTPDDNHPPERFVFPRHVPA